MNSALRRPEEILAYRSLRQILGPEPWSLWTVGPADSVMTALRMMADKNIGFLVVVERGAIVGVLSERDCVLRLMHQHRIRHLPVVDNKRPVAVVSIRDLLSESVQHHEKIIDELERERLNVFTSMA